MAERADLLAPVLTDRAFEVERDYAPLRALLNGALEEDATPWLWPTVRLDSYRYGRHWQSELAGTRDWQAAFHLWEERAGGETRLLGVVHPESDSQLNLELHPRLRADAPARARLEGAMIDWFAAHAAPPGGGPLETMVYRHDTLRQQLLAARGWQNCGPSDVNRSQALDAAAPEEAAPPAGFTVRPMRLDDPAELERLAEATNLVFSVARFQAATWYALANAPTWNEQWLAVAPSGECAAFCGIWYEPALHMGWFEPVGTHPAYRRRGLARAVMAAARRRLHALGARTVALDTGYDMEANHLYAAMGFTQLTVAERWVAP